MNTINRLDQKITQNKNAFQYLLGLPNSAIFAVLDDFKKLAYISYSTNLKHRIGQICSDISDNSFKVALSIENSRLEILETNVDKNFINYYVQEYRNKGYTVYEERLPVQYSFSIVFDIKNRNIMVVAKLKRNDKIVLGNFADIETAKKFLGYVKENNHTNNLIYSIYG